MAEIKIDQRLPMPEGLVDAGYNQSFIDQSYSDDGGNTSNTDTLGGITDEGGNTSNPDNPATNPIPAPSAIVVKQQIPSQGADGSTQIQLVIDVTGSPSDIDYEVRVVAL